MRIFLAIFLFSFSAIPAFADEFLCGKQIEDTEILTKVQVRYRVIESITASFKQESYFLGLNQRALSFGELKFKKPGKMLWKYSNPERQEFNSDGETVWFYQPELNQVTLGSFTDAFSSEVPVSFLIGIGSLSEKFQLEKACKTTAGVLLSLIPKNSEDSFEKFLLLTNEVDASPIGAQVVDVGGNETTILLKDIKYNVKVEDSDFRFEIPKGVDVIDKRSGK